MDRSLFFSNKKGKTMFFYFNTITNHMTRSWLWWSCGFLQYCILNQPCSLLWMGTLMFGRSTWLCCSATSLWFHILSHNLNGDVRRKLRQVMWYCSLSSSCNSEMSDGALSELGQPVPPTFIMKTEAELNRWWTSICIVEQKIKKCSK